MKNQGFTLIELMIVLAIFGILAAIVGNVVTGGNSVESILSGVQCKAGYKFSVDNNGYAQQIIDENGRAIPCN